MFAEVQIVCGKKNKIEKKKTSLKFELSRVDFLFMKAMLSSSGAQIKQPI